jgi:hypothetical protein
VLFTAVVYYCSKISGMYRVIVRYGYMEVVDHGPTFVRQLVSCLVQHVTQQGSLDEDADANIIYSIPSTTGTARPSSWIQMSAASCPNKVATEQEAAHVVLELPVDVPTQPIEEAGTGSKQALAGPELQRWASMSGLTPAEDVLTAAAAAAAMGPPSHTVDGLVEPPEGVQKDVSSRAPDIAPPRPSE